ncbi:hypothetical protein TNCV_4690881 [Trichonephila clavipes]|nr:hypothetical protein TNCV_4690881 [Trichonephila clavipes]
MSDNELPSFGLRSSEETKSVEEHHTLKFLASPNMRTLNLDRFNVFLQWHTDSKPQPTETKPDTKTTMNTRKPRLLRLNGVHEPK